MFFARFQCGRMQAGLTPVKSDKLKDCKNIHRQAMRVRVSFAYGFTVTVKFKTSIKTLLLCIAVFGTFKVLNINCIFYNLTSFPCPCCYMSRAIYKLLQGKFNEYIKLNIMAAPVAAAFVFLLFKNTVKKFSKSLALISYTILTINIIYYIWRIIKFHL